MATSQREIRISKVITALDKTIKQTWADIHALVDVELDYKSDEQVVVCNNNETTPIRPTQPESTDSKLVVGCSADRIRSVNTLLSVADNYRTVWMADATYQLIRDTWQRTSANDDAECKSCGYQAKARMVRKHTRQHFTRHFCSCKFTDVDREVVLSHVEDHATPHMLYTVDEPSYSAFCQAVGWEKNSGHFPCVPRRTRDDQTMRPAPARPNTDLRKILKPYNREYTRTSRAPHGEQPCQAQDATNSRPPLSRRERAKLVAKCLGRAPPTYRARSNLKKQVDTLAREHRQLLEKADYVREKRRTAESETDRQVLKEQAEAYETIAYRHWRGLKGLKGERL